MNEELPQGWVITTLGEICSKPQYGWTCRGAKTGKVKYVRTTDISNGAIHWATVPYCEDAPPDIEKYRVKPNDILVSRAGSVGVSFRVADVPGDAVFASYLIRFNPLDRIEPKYVELFLKSDGYWRSISDFTAGIAVPNVNASKLASLELPLAPLPEQERIVAKLETLLVKVESCQKRLAKVSGILKHFRQAVLAAACSRRLTADWREKYNFAAECDDTWVEEIADYVGGFAYKSPSFLGSGNHQVIRIGNVRPIMLRLDASPVFIPDDLAQQTERFKVLPGDILISMTGTKYKHDYGHAALVGVNDGSLFINQRVARLRCGQRVLPKFLLFWLQTGTFRDFFFRDETGNVNQGNVGAEGIRKAPIQLPSIAEQQEIIRRVESLFALADRIEARYNQAQASVDQLTRSLLGKAFCGELVATEAATAKIEGRRFESAEELLKRIAINGNGAVATPPARPNRRRTR